MTGPDRQFWQERFESGQTPWDRGAPSPQLAAWLEAGLLDRTGTEDPMVVVPGCGSGHELVALARRGLRVIGLDYAPEAVRLARQRVEAAGFGGRVAVVEGDVLAWEPEHAADAVYEQTCLCALHPDQWTAYAAQLRRWLRPGGMLLALAMQVRRPSAAEGVIEGPPYHVDINALRALFPGEHWSWPKPPFAVVPHPLGAQELAVPLTRR